MTQLANRKSVADAATESESSDSLKRLQQARAYLMVHHPFFSVLVLSLKLVESTLTETMATDGRNIYYSPKFVLGMTVKQTASVLAHEGLHVALGHHLRRGNRDSYWWNVAADYAINGPLIESRLYDLPDGGLYDPKYAKESAERIYAEVFEKDDEPEAPDQPDDDDGEGEGDEEGEGEGEGDDEGEGEGDDDGEGSDGDGDGDGSDGDGDGDGEGKGKGKGKGEGEGEGEGDESEGGSGGGGGHGPKPKPRPLPVGEIWDGTTEDGGKLTPESIADQEREIAARVFEAHAAEKSAGTGSAGAFRGILADKKGDDLPWGQILSMHMQELLVVDSTFSKPNRRFIGQGIILPGPQKLPNGTLVFAVDTSGSLGQEELDIICGNVNDIVDEIQPLDVYVIYCDYSINKVIHFELGDTIVMNAYGGGGTRFAPPFNWVTQEGITPDVFVYFTDGYGWVESEMLDDGTPDYPVIWASTGRAPTFDKGEEFGEVVEIGRIL